MADGYYDHARPEALDLLPSCPTRFLDIGCARGGVSRELRRRFPQAVAVGCDLFTDPDFDYSEVFSEFARVDLENEEIPYDLNSFDLILLLDVLEHLRQPDELFGRLVAGASDGCYFLVSLPNFHYYSNLFAIIRSGRFAYTEDGILDRTHLRFFGMEDARSLLAGHVEIQRTLAFNPFENTKSRLIGRLLGDRYRAYQNIFLCRKRASAV
jgi:2-polyprenyl-3-methyl-5-hydroxy-6-metoxy-1,4-benzoquinol methylase